MARKITAFFVMCIVLVATFYVHETAAAVDATEEFRSCFNTCKDECLAAQSGQNTHCEIKCDNECASMEKLHKINTVVNN
ncbi:hypothetical protein MKX01_009314 [Papaver californicum]|nr:hypothetical protein MKX01_009314 [Papaver californicum]